jgi:hypothetical protein
LRLEFDSERSNNDEKYQKYPGQFVQMSDSCSGERALGWAENPTCNQESKDNWIRNGSFIKASESDRQQATTSSSVNIAANEITPTVLILDAEKNHQKETKTTFPWIMHYQHFSMFAILGAVLRIYMGRFFGLDCESGDGDFDICVTASGKTAQTGGALFTDLPANMLGTYVQI